MTSQLCKMSFFSSSWARVSIRIGHVFGLSSLSLAFAALGAGCKRSFKGRKGVKLTSSSFRDGAVIPADYAVGSAGGFAGNRNPHLKWSSAPAATRSFALFCIDQDALSAPSGDSATLLEQARAGFFHWVMVDIPAYIREIDEGVCSDGFVPRGKSSPWSPPGARQGLNDFTHRFYQDEDMAGHYAGYDGPYPNFNDGHAHRYFFQVFALNVDALWLPTQFTAGQAVHAMAAHVLDQAEIYGWYAFNPTLAQVACLPKRKAKAGISAHPVDCCES